MDAHSLVTITVKEIFVLKKITYKNKVSNKIMVITGNKGNKLFNCGYNINANNIITNVEMYKKD